MSNTGVRTQDPEGRKLAPEPLQDTSLDDIFDNHGQTIGYGDYYQTETLADIKIEIMAWHKAERAKLFEQIRSEVIGDDEYPDEHFPVYLGHKDDALAKKFDEVVTRDRLKTEQREALTRLEKNEKVTE